MIHIGKSVKIQIAFLHKTCKVHNFVIAEIQQTRNKNQTEKKVLLLHPAHTQ